MKACTIFASCLSYRGIAAVIADREVKKRRRGYLPKRKWICDKYVTLKSAAGVVLICLAVAIMLLMIRVVGEKKLQHFLDFLLFFKRRQSRIRFVSEALMSKNRIYTPNN